MKRILLFFISIAAICFIGCSSEKRDLYNIADKFVNSLDTDYESYGLLGGAEHTEYTESGYYKIMPIGRLINVRIEKDVESKEYEKLKNNLTRHFKNNALVNDVYICQGGTIMIDCRN